MDAASRRRGAGRSTVIRDALVRYLDSSAPVRRSMYEAAKDLCGIAKSGIPDLATNPRHMEGFGLPRYRKRPARGRGPR